VNEQKNILTTTTEYSFSQQLFDDLYRFLRVRFSNLDRDDVRDAIGDAVEKAILNGKCRLKHKELLRWLYRSAFNRCIDTYRKNRKTTHLLEDGNEHGFDAKPNQLNDEPLFDLSFFSLSLSSADRIILTCLLEGESVQEIAEKCGMAVKTVYKHKKSIAVRIREWLDISSTKRHSDNTR